MMDLNQVEPVSECDRTCVRVCLENKDDLIKRIRIKTMVGSVRNDLGLFQSFGGGWQWRGRRRSKWRVFGGRRQINGSPNHHDHAAAAVDTAKKEGTIASWLNQLVATVCIQTTDHCGLHFVKVDATDPDRSFNRSSFEWIKLYKPSKATCDRVWWRWKVIAMCVPCVQVNASRLCQSERDELSTSNWFVQPSRLNAGKGQLEHRPRIATLLLADWRWMNEMAFISIEVEFKKVVSDRRFKSLSKRNYGKGKRIIVFALDNTKWNQH